MQFSLAAGLTINSLSYHVGSELLTIRQTAISAWDNATLCGPFIAVVVSKTGKWRRKSTPRPMTVFYHPGPACLVRGTVHAGCSRINHLDHGFADDPGTRRVHY